MTMDGESNDAASPIDAIMDAIRSVTEEQDLALQLGIIMARRWSQRRIGVLAYAILFAINDANDLPWRPDLQDLRQRLFSVARSGEYTEGGDDDPDGVIVGNLALAGLAMYRTLTYHDDSRTLLEALECIEVEQRNPVSE